MSSIIRARSALTGRWEGWEVIGGSSLELKVAGPSMLGIGCPDRHALLFTRSPSLPRMHRPRRLPLPQERGRSRGMFGQWRRLRNSDSILIASALDAAGRGRPTGNDLDPRARLHLQEREIVEIILGPRG